MKYLVLLLLALQSTLATAQSSCSSDNVAPLRALAERFIPADCASCWAEPLAAPPSVQVLDWIVPGSAGEDAPLSAAATVDAESRLASLKLALGKEQHVAMHRPTNTPGYRLRVAHGLAVNGYMGTSIELQKYPRGAKDLTAVLLLVETIPQGTADSPIARLLVRNMLQETWPLPSRHPVSAARQPLLSRRPMSLPQGTNPDHLQVMGWVQNAQGRLLAAVQSRCAPDR